jgi:hypothetical protein
MNDQAEIGVSGGMPDIIGAIQIDKKVVSQ